MSQSQYRRVDLGIFLKSYAHFPECDVIRREEGSSEIFEFGWGSGIGKDMKHVKKKRNDDGQKGVVLDYRWYR